jgi:hypothetical protein
MRVITFSEIGGFIFKADILLRHIKVIVPNA